jgi:broad specificity phosphatase PhoE
MRAMRIAFLLMLLVPAAASASEDLWKRLQAGGQVILIRHTITEAGVGDPPGMRLDECASQRNLSDEGRAHARRIGAAFRARNVPVSRVLSSPWCRCLETARLAFGKAEVSTPLSNLFGRHENRAAQVHDLKEILRTAGEAGNLVLVTHGSTILALSGVSPGTGELVIMSPDGKVLGRLASE